MTSPAGVARLEWDSSFFGLEIGRVTDTSTVEHLTAAVREADEVGLDCCYLLIEGNDHGSLANAQDLGFRVVDVRVMLARSLDANSEISEVGAVRPGVEQDRGWILDIARTRFAFSRFRADLRFPRDAAGRMFAAWATRGLDDPRRQTLVCDARTGFVVCGREGAAGSIELIATQHDAPRGTGSRLLRAATASFVDAGCAEARVVTQGANVPAIRLYEAAGFRVSSSAYWLHRWR